MVGFGRAKTPPRGLVGRNGAGASISGNPDPVDMTPTSAMGPLDVNISVATESTTSSLVCASPAGVGLAPLTFPNKPEWARMAKIARPLDEGIVRFDHEKPVCACLAGGERHLDCRVEGCFRCQQAKEFLDLGNWAL